MNLKAALKWNKDFVFECFNNNFKTFIDASSEHGGNDSAPSPKMLLLDSLMGCCAIDTLSTLNKMRMPTQSFEIELESTQSSSFPIHFTSIKLIFKISGELKNDKLIMAIDKSINKYCGISYMLSKSCNLSFDIFLNEQLIHSATRLDD